MSDQPANYHQLKKTYDLYQFMLKLCWLKSYLEWIDEKGRMSAKHQLLGDV